ncbi:BatD family protein [Imhoffiella purpurea]|uniref:BatD n=1 Tax=Imhoffiella purpurea TaxID=1249627 RepID=W9VU59_9GAMM|nr:BatD family protein [Imhoffiella purpurea]EXJ13890.1 hypothetical protein D779_3197 [Imhoffiella purpurea]
MVIPSVASRRSGRPRVVAVLLGLLLGSALTGVYGQPYYGQPYPGQPYQGRAYPNQPYGGQGYYPPPYAQGQAPRQGQQPVYGQPPDAYGRNPSPYSSEQPSSTPQYRPVPPSNAQGVPPSYRPPSASQGMPNRSPYGAPSGYPSGWPPSYGQPSGGSPSFASATLNWSLVESAPYLQQPVILELELVSQASPSKLDLELPSSGDVLLKTIEGSTTDSRRIDGRREVVNSFVVTLVPLRTGALELPAIRAVGNWSSGQRFEVETDRPVRLQVRPSMTSVRPWLPLESLSLKSSLDRQGMLEPGQPVTLTLDISAEGATAVQLPSLENQLRGEGFRVYREQTLTDTQISQDKRRLLARRTEYYTLVPRSGGRITLPEMSIAWWNVERGVREVARLPLKTLEVSGGGPFGLSAESLSGATWLKVWLPILALLLLVAGYWVGVLYRGRPLQAFGDLALFMWRGLSAGLRLTLGFLRRYLGNWSFRSLLVRFRSAWYRSMSPGSRFLRCLRQANRADDPADWCRLFEAESRACGTARGDLNRPSLVRQILRHRPGADPLVLHRLMDQLDAARFADQPLDFRRWKRELMGQVGRGAGVLRARRAGTRVRWAALPELNPR